MNPNAAPGATLGATLSVRIQPNASKNEVVGIIDEVLKIKINAPPVDGKANKECIKFLAKALNVSKSHVSIIAGEKARAKVVRIMGISQDTCWKRLTSGLQGEDERG